VIKPIVKWAGGKRQILAHLIDRLPISWEHYYEPFIGGGALFIALSNMGMIKKATISDANPELVNLYHVIQKRPNELVGALKHPELKNTREKYIELRNTFNRKRGDPTDAVERAALFLYLNRHGYNGLWRVNRNGEFNVPFGRYQSPRLPSPGLILGFSRLLESVTIQEGDFARTMENAREGDFVYCDPPYFPISSTSRFTAYHAKEFSFEDQVRLSRVCRSLTRRNVSLMISNSWAPQICQLYQGFHNEMITALRAINSRGDRRTGVPEMIITNYLPDRDANPLNPSE
jgi:DNA adenine methylase